MKQSADWESNPETIDGDIHLSLCAHDAATVTQLVNNGVSPLSRCDVRYVTHTRRGTWKAFVDSMVPVIALARRKQRQRERAQKWTRTVAIIAAVVMGNSDALQDVTDSTVIEAKIIVLSLADLGITSGPLIDKLRNQ